MRTILHIGPHKTGTTSIQSYLLERFGSREPAPPVWYPTPERQGPGHAELASMIEIGGGVPTERVLRRIVELAGAARVETLILSSEDFIGASPGRLAGHGPGLRDAEVWLVSTQNPLTRRLASLWQETVKHGHASSLADEPEAVLDRRAVQPGVLSALADALQPRRIGIVFTDPRDPPELLIDRFLAAAELEPDAPQAAAARSVKHNPSLGAIETELLRSLNERLRAELVPYERARALRHALIGTFRSPTWQAHCPRREIELPAELRRVARERAARLTAEIRSLAERWDVRLFGDPEVLAL